MRHVALPKLPGVSSYDALDGIREGEARRPQEGPVAEYPKGLGVRHRPLITTSEKYPKNAVKKSFKNATKSA